MFRPVIGTTTIVLPLRLAAKMLYIKIHYIYATTLSTNAYSVTIWLIYATSAVYKRQCGITLFDSLKMISCEPKHVGILSVIL